MFLSLLVLNFWFFLFAFFCLSHIVAAPQLDSLLCGGDAIDEAWDLSVDTLSRYCKLQGYQSRDKTVVALFECISEFSPKQQRQFVRFVTGCPRLPLGGLKALDPCMFYTS
jgi:E3 ubiquitin-protein ligase TRIP12